MAQAVSRQPLIAEIWVYLRTKLTNTQLQILQVLIREGAWMFVLMSVVCCQVRISVMGRTQVQRDLQSVCLC